jgi:hypothetical protein
VPTTSITHASFVTYARTHIKLHMQTARHSFAKPLEFKATDVIFWHLPNYHIFATHVHEWPLRGGRVMDNMEAVVASPNTTFL